MKATTGYAAAPVVCFQPSPWRKTYMSATTMPQTSRSTKTYASGLSQNPNAIKDSILLQTEASDVGTLVVDIYDANGKQMVRRGISHGPLSSKSSKPETAEQSDHKNSRTVSENEAVTTKREVDTEL
jgi:hypothetical protein